MFGMRRTCLGEETCL